MLSAPSPDGATLYRLASDTKLGSLLPWKQNKKQASNVPVYSVILSSVIQDHHNFLAGLSQNQLLVLYQTGKYESFAPLCHIYTCILNRDELSVIDFSHRMPVGHTMFLPVAVKRVHLFSLDQWMIEDCTGK